VELLATTMIALGLAVVTGTSQPTTTAASHWAGWPCTSYHGACHGPVRPL